MYLEMYCMQCHVSTSPWREDFIYKTTECTCSHHKQTSYWHQRELKFSPPDSMDGTRRLTCDSLGRMSPLGGLTRMSSLSLYGIDHLNSSGMREMFFTLYTVWLAVPTHVGLKNVSPLFDSKTSAVSAVQTMGTLCNRQIGNLTIERIVVSSLMVLADLGFSTFTTNTRILLKMALAFSLPHTYLLHY